MKTIICDLDGTLFNIDERLKYIQGEKKDWDGFFSEDAIKTDKPQEWCVELLHGAISRGHQVVFVSGRNEVAGTITRTMLDDLGFHASELIMRPADNREEDFKLKESFYEELLADREILFVVEDRKQVVDMWRSKGLVVLQCDAGEF